jgi:hypothetical protein
MMVVTSLAVWLMTALPGPPASFADMDRAFVCPEALPDDAARTAALRDFIDAAAKAAPKESIPKVLQYRRSLLEKHGCLRTLQSLEDSEARVRNGAVLDQAWAPVVSGPVIALSVSSTYVKPYEDPRDPAEYAVETYVKLSLRTPSETNATHTRYDQVVSHNVYYCRTGRYALIENDYFFSGRLVLKDPSPPRAFGSQTVYDVTAIPAGSLNETAARSVCVSNPGSTASLSGPVSSSSAS